MILSISILPVLPAGYSVNKDINRYVVKVYDYEASRAIEHKIANSRQHAIGIVVDAVNEYLRIHGSTFQVTTDTNNLPDYRWQCMHITISATETQWSVHIISSYDIRHDGSYDTEITRKSDSSPFNISVTNAIGFVMDTLKSLYF